MSLNRSKETDKVNLVSEKNEPSNINRSYLQLIYSKLIGKFGQTSNESKINLFKFEIDFINFLNLISTYCSIFKKRSTPI